MEGMTGSTLGPGVRLTRIIATIGPSCTDIGTIRDMIRAGMDVARLNLSHGTQKEHEKVCSRVRQASREIGKPVAVMTDIPGPKLRITSLQDELAVHPGEQITLSATPESGEIGIGSAVYIPDIRQGDIILIGDGAVTLTATRGGDTIGTTVTAGGTIRPGAGVVIPGRRPPVPYENEELLKNLTFIAGLNPDFIALSFVGSAGHIHFVRSFFQKKGIRIPIIAKVETEVAVDRFDEILNAADGIMVARGDLGVELPFASVPHIQKDIIRRCNKAGIPVITATEMLESMIEHTRPTRAEVTDVANAIADGTDATMLSAETSIGRNPCLAVQTMAHIACEIEKHLPYRKILDERADWQEDNPEGIISFNACYLAHKLASRAIVAFTRSGITAGRVSRCRPGTPIIAITPDEAVARRLLLRWGVISCIHEPIQTADELFTVSLHLTHAMGLTRTGDRLVIIAGNFAGIQGTTNMIKVQVVP
jgi:pyruvate kinase